MKILFIDPPLSKEDRYGKELEEVGPTCEPLGLAYLAASILKNTNYQIEILDALALNYSYEELSNFLEKGKYGVIGIMMLTPMYLRAIETIRVVKKNTKAKVIVGGPHATIFPEQTLKENPEIDIVVIGEGEETIVELANAIESKKTLKNIKGITFREGKNIIKTEPREFIKDIDNIPIPARNLLPMDKYKPAPTYYKKLPSYIILTSRGCPYRCVYCSKVFGRNHRQHSVKRVINEMNTLIEDYNVKEIIFRDDTFTVNKEFVKELCNEIIKQGLNKKVSWTCMTRVNLVDLELLKLMKKAGCWSIHYGVESGSQRLIDLIQKDITLEQVRKAFKWTKQAHIEVKAFFMLGLPTETREESLQTIRFTKTCRADWIQVTLTVPYPGTKLYDLALKDGTLKSFKWENYQTWAGWTNKDLVYIPSNRNQEELKELQKRAMREFYLTPKFIIKQVANLKSVENIKTYFKGGIALLKSKM